MGGLVVLGSGAVTAQEDDELRLEELEEEREALQQDLAEAASQVDASQATFEEVLTALDDINALVDLQEARLSDAQQAVRSAERLVQQAELRIAEIAMEQAALRQTVSDLAVASFTGESGENGEDLTALLLNENPTEAARRRSLVQLQTGNLGDTLDRVRQLNSEAEQVEATCNGPSKPRWSTKVRWNSAEANSPKPSISRCSWYSMLRHGSRPAWPRRSSSINSMRTWPQRFASKKKRSPNGFGPKRPLAQQPRLQRPQPPNLRCHLRERSFL